MAREIIHTIKAPQAIGTYSQAVKVDNVVYLSGQIPLVPETMEVVDYHEIHLKNEKTKYAKTVGFYMPKSKRVSESFVSLCNSRVRK